MGRHKLKPEDLTQDYLQSILDYDALTGIFKWTARRQGTRVGRQCGCVGPLGYRQIYVRGHHYMAHRLAWFYVYGHWPAAFIDHINGDTDDNRIDNLREADAVQSAWNTRKQKNNTSGYKGVHFSKGSKKKWQATIHANHQRHVIGYYETPEEASAAYNSAAAKLHGEFARIE